MTETVHTLQEFWHGCLIALLSGVIIAGLGYYFHLRLGHAFLNHGGALIGTLGRAIYCIFIVIRLKKRFREDRANARLSFPRFGIGPIRDRCQRRCPSGSLKLNRRRGLHSRTPLRRPRRDHPRLAHQPKHRPDRISCIATRV